MKEKIYFSSAFRKRQAKTYVFACEMRAIFALAITNRMKNSMGPVIQEVLKQGLQPAKIIWPQLIFNVDGVPYSFRPRHIGFYYCSTIGTSIL